MKPELMLALADAGFTTEQIAKIAEVIRPKRTDADRKKDRERQARYRAGALDVSPQTEPPADTSATLTNVTPVTPVTRVTPPPPSPPSMVSPITPSLTTPSSPSPTTGKRATRLPDDWTPSEKDLEYAAKLGVGGVTLAYEINKFRNHWTSKSGKDAAKLRWDRTWQNWIIGAKERSNGKTRFNQPAGGVGDAAAALARHASDGGVTIPARPRLGG